MNEERGRMNKKISGDKHILPLVLLHHSLFRIHHSPLDSLFSIRYKGEMQYGHYLDRKGRQ
jgi:hypothetical protein